MDEFKDILSSRLAEIFEGETQQSIADRLYTGQGTVSKWLNGESIPPTSTLFLIAKTYKVSVDSRTESRFHIDTRTNKKPRS